ncbi:MAG TPA: hypothetical protein VGH28_04120 [Polyangiaceae bacterium]|jgi:hypothetical protein
MNGWDRASPGYLAQWQPQLAPYDVDLAFELGLREGDCVLSTPGSEVVALARAVGDRGRVHAVAATEDVLVLCKERVRASALADRVETLAAPRGPYDAAVSAFDFDVAAGRAHLAALREAIGPRGKIGVMLWGPPAEDDPERVFARAIDAVAPEIAASAVWPDVARATLASLFEAAGLALIRHTVVSHAMIFQHAERFATALLAARSYGPKLRALGDPAVAAVLARFYERVGQDDAISYAPAATIVIGALPGAEIELPHRPSVRVPVI